MKWPLPSGQILLFEGRTSFLLVGRADTPFTLYIETMEGEVPQSVAPDDLVAVSSPEGGPYEPAVMLLELVRRYHTPLVVLPRDHPGSRRLSYVVSVAPSILTSCTIRRGTHPEQHLLCSSEELAGLTLDGRDGGVEADRIPEGAVVRYFTDL
jgi:hypothetical protein